MALQIASGTLSSFLILVLAEPKAFRFSCFSVCHKPGTRQIVIPPDSEIRQLAERESPRCLCFVLLPRVLVDTALSTRHNRFIWCRTAERRGCNLCDPNWYWFLVTRAFGTYSFIGVMQETGIATVAFHQTHVGEHKSCASCRVHT